MSPPIIPEIATCGNSGGDKVIVLVRVPQSEHAPHALHRNSALYIRTGKRTKPEDLADLDRIDWLRGRRKKSEELREWIFDRACVRFRDMRDGKVGGVPTTDEGAWGPMGEQPGLLTIALCTLAARVHTTPGSANLPPARQLERESHNVVTLTAAVYGVRSQVSDIRSALGLLIREAIF
jgi:hypothetical protein